MPREKYIIIVSDQISGVSWHYSSISAALEHIENPLDIGNRRWSQIVKERGYPFDHSGCRIDRRRLWSLPEVREDNPPLI